MKKLLGCLLVVMMCFAACQGPIGPTGPMGPPGKNADPTYWKVIDFTVARKDWKLYNVYGEQNEIGSYYYYVFDVPELSTVIFDEGAIICYYRYRDEFGDIVQTPLPYTYYDIFVNQRNEEFPYSVQYSYDVMPGSIAFKVVFSDFFTDENEPPASCNFRLHLIY